MKMLDSVSRSTYVAFAAYTSGVQTISAMITTRVPEVIRIAVGRPGGRTTWNERITITAHATARMRMPAMMTFSQVSWTTICLSLSWKARAAVTVPKTRTARSPMRVKPTARRPAQMCAIPQTTAEATVSPRARQSPATGIGSRPFTARPPYCRDAMKSPAPLLVAGHNCDERAMQHRAVCKVIDWKRSVTLGEV